LGKERVMARGAAVAVGGGGHGSRRAWRASRGLPRLLWASRVKEKGMGAGKGGRAARAAARHSAGRGCRRAWRVRRSGESARVACALEWG
jgi:hypothetical protein